MFWDICTSIARLTKQPKLVPDIFSESVPLVPCRGTQANVAKIPFKLKGQIEKIFRRLLVSPRLGTKGTDLLELSCTSFGCLVNRAILVQISQNKLRVPQDD